MGFCKIVNTGHVKQSLWCREKPGKSKISAALGQKRMCVSVSVELQCGNLFTPGGKIFGIVQIHFGKRDTFSQKAKCREDTYEFKYFIN